MRILIALVFVAACAAPTPPAVAPKPVIERSPPPIAPVEEPLVSAPMIDRALLGRWAWDSDVEEFRADGTGTYTRNARVCFEFTYSVEHDIVTQQADRDHECGEWRTTKWRIAIDGDKKTVVHLKSGYETVWARME